MIVVWCSDPYDAEEFLVETFVRAGVSSRFVPLHEPPNAQPHDVLLVCGKAGFSRLQRAKVAPGNRALSSMRGKLLHSPQHVPLLVTFDPFLRYRDAGAADEIKWDARLAVRLHETGTLVPQIGEYVWCSFGDVEAGLRAALETQPIVRMGADSETVGRYPWYPDKYIVSVQFSWIPGTAACVYLNDVKGVISSEDWSSLDWILNEPRLRVFGANFKYDLQWFWRRWGIRCTNFALDTLTSGSLVNENRSNSLDSHARTYTPMGGYADLFNQSFDKGRMDLVPKDALLPYAGGDADAVLQTGLRLAAELNADPKLRFFYTRVFHPAGRAFERVEDRGVLADPARFAALRTEVCAAIEEHTQKAIDQIPLRVRQKHIEKLSLSRPDVIRDAFFSKAGWNLKPVDVTAKTKKPSTNATHLKKFSEHPKAAVFLEHYTAVSKARKTLSTYIDGFLEHLRPDGMFHPTYVLYHGSLHDRSNESDTGSTTGRLATRDPAINVLSKRTVWAKPLRKCYPAPKNSLFWQADFNQGELRVIAALANETNMIEAYRKGIDMHANTAAGLGGLSIEDFLAYQTTNPGFYDLERSKAKAGNFGLIYGMREYGFIVYALDNFGVKFTHAQAKEFRDGYFALYPGLLDYHAQMEEEVKLHKQVRNPLGRIRHLPLVDSPDEGIRSKAIRQAINSPVQGALNDTCLLFLVELEKAFEGEDHRFSVRGSTHDALYGYVHENFVEEGLSRAQSVADQIPKILDEEFGWALPLPLPVDWELGPDWGSLEKVTIAA